MRIHLPRIEADESLEEFESENDWQYGDGEKHGSLNQGLSSKTSSTYPPTIRASAAKEMRGHCPVSPHKDWQPSGIAQSGNSLAVSMA